MTIDAQTRRFAALAALCATAVGGYFVSRWRSFHYSDDRQRGDLVSLMSDDQPQRQGQLTQIEARLRKVEHLQGAALGSQLTQDLRNQSSEHSGVKRIEGNEAQRGEREKFSRYFAELDRLRETQPPDRELEKEAGLLFAGTIQAVNLPSIDMKLDRLDCGGNLCRVELSYSKDQANPALQALYSSIVRVGVALPEASLFNDPETGHATAYFSRKGFSLPPI